MVGSFDHRQMGQIFAGNGALAFLGGVFGLCIERAHQCFYSLIGGGALLLALLRVVILQFECEVCEFI